MSLNKTYSELKTDIADWIMTSGGATDLSARTTEFIGLAEELHKFGDPQKDLPGIRIRQMLKRSRAVGEDGIFLALPDDFLEMRYLRKIVTTGDGKLNQIPHESLDRTSGQTTVDSYAIGRELQFNTTLASTQTVEMLYYAPFTSLSDSNTSNWLLLNCYSAYLYGSLIHAAPYLGDTDMAKVWAEMYMNAVIRLQGTDHRSRVNKGEAKVSIPERYVGP